MRDHQDSEHDVRRAERTGGLTSVECTLILSIVTIVTIFTGTILQVSPSDLVDGLASMF